MENVKLKILFPNQGAKKIALQPTYDELTKTLRTSLEKLTLKYTFSLPEEYHTKLPCFFNDETYLAFKEEVLKRNLEPNTILTLKIIIVDEYPFLEQVKELSLLDKYKIIIEDSTKTLRNSLFAQFPQKALVQSKNAYETEKSSHSSLKVQDIVPKDILCKQCFNTAPIGNVFICCECVNYTLCSICEACNPHDISHVFVMLTQPLSDDLQKYECCVVDNKKTYSIDSTMQNGSVNIRASVTLINNGIEQWENCSLQSVTFGDMYLNGPKVQIDSVIQKLTKIEVFINAIFTSTGTFQSNWRIFNSSGVPFGELITFEFIIH